MRIAIIGFGEVGRCYGEALSQAPNIDLVVCESKISPVTSTLCKKLNVPLYTSIGPWLSEVDLVFSCVVGRAALEVAQQCFSHIRRNTCFVDFTTAAPEDKRSAASRATANGMTYVDVAIMGAIASSGIAVPLVCAGEGAEEFSRLINSLGAEARALPGKAGDAIALKILRSVLTKGMESLAVEIFMAAEKQGIRNEFYEILGDIDRVKMSDFLNMLVTTHVVHASRRLHEVEEAERQLANNGVESIVLPGVRRRFSKTVDLLKEKPQQKTMELQDAIRWLSAG